MARELAITLYLAVFRSIFSLCKLFPQKKKTTFVASFGENILCTIKEVEKQTDNQVVVLKTSQCSTDFESPDRTVLRFEMSRLFDWLRSIYHLATAHHIIMDNYYGFLAATDFKPGVKCIQLWHATGAIKKFGLEDPSIKNRSTAANKRFRKVYNRFDSVIVGSDKMASIFKQSFGVSDNTILQTGVPRTDFFFDESAKQKAINDLTAEYPIIQNKKVILYAPTYRDGDLDVKDVALDIKKMFNTLKHEYVLFLRLHPAINNEFQNKFPGFVINVSSHHHMNHLLMVTDVLVTDYSSIPFEFSLLHRPMVFFAYDLDKYAIERGFWETYEDMVPGPVVENTHDLIDVLKNEYFDTERIKTFAAHWNQYSQGDSSAQLVEMVYSEDKHYEVVHQN